MSGIFITVEIGKNVKIVEIIKYNTSETLDYYDYVYSALQNSEINFEDFDCFLNLHGARVEPDVFLNYVNQFILHPCACFVLRVKIKTILEMDDYLTFKPTTLSNTFTLLEDCNKRKMCDLNGTLVENDKSKHLGALKRSNATIGSSVFVTSESFKQFISLKAGGSSIYADFTENGLLKDIHRRKIVSFLAAYIHEQFGFNPSKDDLLSAAEACVTLFPCLKLDLLVNSNNTGFLQVKLKNDRVKKRKIEKEFEPVSTTRITEPADNSIETLDIQKDLYTLKTLSLPEEIQLARDKLKATSSYRKLSFKKEGFIIHENCKCFYTSPELILYDFQINYGPTPHLKTEWEIYQRNIFTLVKNAGKQILYTEFERKSDWDSRTLSFINLVCLLPPSSVGRKKFSRLTDDKAVHQLVLFKSEGLINKEYLAEASGRAPYIIATGTSKSVINQYLIVLDGNLIPLAPGLHFIDVVDIVFKLHFLFDIKYDNNLRLFWIFLQNYVYKMELVNLPITLVDLHIKFEKLAERN